MKAVTVSMVHDDAATAGEEVATELLEQLGQRPDLVLLFASTRYDPGALLEGLFRRLPPGVKLAGCSSCAEINVDEAVLGSITAMGIRLGSNVECEVFKVDELQGRSFEAGRELGERVKQFSPRLLIALPDGVRTNSAQFIGGLKSVLGERFPIVGGVAADNLEFSRTYEFFGREVLSGGAVAVALKGDFTFVSAARSGWQPLGAARTCTRVEGGRLLLELDGVPALQIYKDFLGERAGALQSLGLEFPLGVVSGMPGDYKVSDEQLLVVRAVQQVDEGRGGLLCSGEIYEGARVRMTRAAKSDLIDGAVSAIDEALAALPDPSLALFFDCAGRKLVLGARYKDEISDVFARMGKHIPKIGFYTYGELSPVQGITLHHDETFTLALLKA